MKNKEPISMMKTRMNTPFELQLIRKINQIIVRVNELSKKKPKVRRELQHEQGYKW